MTINSGSSENPRIACDANFCYVVWQDNRSGNWEIYWCKTDLNGVKVLGDVKVCTTAAASVKPAIGVDSLGNSYIVRQEDSPYGTIYLAKLDPNGNKIFDKPISPYLSLNPDIATSLNGMSHIVYERWTIDDHRVYYAKYDSVGNVLCAAASISTGTLPPWEHEPKICCDSVGCSYMIWRDMDTDWHVGLWSCKKRANCSTEGYLVFHLNDAIHPDIAYGGGYSWLVFEQNGKIYNLVSAPGCQISQGTATSRNPEVGSDGCNGFVTWEDNRNGNWEIYLCKFYGCNNLSGDQRITNNSNNSVQSDISVLPGCGNKWYLVWQDDRDGNNEIYWSKNLPCSTVTFTVKLKIESGADTLAREAVVIVRRADGSVTTDTTDENGRVTFNLVCVGDEIYAFCLVGWGRTDKEASHPLLSKFTGGPSYPAFYEFYKTNQYLDNSDTLRYPLYQGNHEIVLDYKITYLNLVMSYKRAVANPSEELDSLRSKFRSANQFLFDATNGQVLIKRVDIFDDGGSIFTEHADLKIENDKSHSISTVFDFVRPFPMPSYVPTRWYMFADDRFLEENAYKGTTKTYNFQTGLIHELGHYFLKLGDEYRYSTKDRCVSSSEPDQKEHRASIMSGYKLGQLNHEFCDDVHNTQLLWAEKDGSPIVQNNAHNFRSCWHYLANIAPPYPDSNWIDLFRNLAAEPGDYVFGDTIKEWNPPVLTPGFSYQEGPYLKTGTYLLAPHDSVSVNDFLSYHPTVRDLKFTIVDDLGRTIKNVNIFIRSSGEKWRQYVINIKGSKKEPFEVRGLFTEDMILFTAYEYELAKFRVEDLSGDPVIAVLKKLDTKKGVITFAGELNEGDIKLLEGGVDIGGSSLQLRLKTKIELSSPPVVSVLQDGAQQEISATMSDTGSNSYMVSLPLSDSLPYKGILWFSDTLFVCPQVWDAQFVSSDQSNFLMLNNAFELSIPEGALSTNRYITAITSPLPKDLIEIGAVPIMGCQSISLSEEVDFLSSAYFSFYYGAGLIDSTVCLYKWDEISDNWTKLGSNVDTSYMAIFDSISKSGLYSVFAIYKPDPRLTVLYPNGGVWLDTGKVDTILWNNNIGSSSDSLHLYLSLDGGWTYPILLYRSTNDDTTCSHQWCVLDSISTKCKILIMYYLPSEDVVYDESDCVFSIGPSSSCPGYEDVSPSSFWVSHNYPNPFNPVTTIEYALPKGCYVEITIYNILGQKVTSLVHESQKAGHYVIEWNGKSDHEEEVASGIYFYQLKAGEFSECKKMLLLK